MAIISVYKTKTVSFKTLFFKASGSNNRDLKNVYIVVSKRLGSRKANMKIRSEENFLL